MSAPTQPGDHVWAKDASGELLSRVAITGEIDGRDFPVVWVCKDEDYEESRRHSYPPKTGDFTAPGVPWPVEDVTPRGGES